jgi:peptidoglycan hydrolase CwlO-like protein
MRAAAPVVVALVLGLLLLGRPSVANSSTGLSAARAQLDSITARIRAAQTERDALKAQISALFAQIDANRRALERQQPKVEATKAAVVDLSGEVATQQAALDARAAAIYEEGPASALALLLDSTSFADFEARLEYVGSVARGDKDLITQLTDRKAELEVRGTALSASVAALQATKGSLGSEASALSSKLAQQLKAISGLNHDLATAQALVNKLNRQLPLPTPTPTPPPTPPPSGESVQALITQYFTSLGSGMVQKALCVAGLESGFNPNAVNPESGAAGVFQFIPSVWPLVSQAAGWGGASVFDAQANVAVAAWEVGQFGWSMWSADSKACGL